MLFHVKKERRKKQYAEIKEQIAQKHVIYTE